VAKRYAAAQMNPCCRNFPLGYYLCQCLRLDDSSRRTRVTVQEVQAVREKPIAGGCTSFPCLRVLAPSPPHRPPRGPAPHFVCRRVKKPQPVSLLLCMINETKADRYYYLASRAEAATRLLLLSLACPHDDQMSNCTRFSEVSSLFDRSDVARSWYSYLLGVSCVFLFGRAT